eukprot:TRINITY_DN18498_c0_g1_i1.p1 TRINITY_DN18498_c0_g1~~TRINITY_DN18498_c0_g1_i1.p1  ORF type:complete len:795 (+),score=104.76 TRINITY_DN18498_c0_g1_i1:86-2470(+)
MILSMLVLLLLLLVAERGLCVNITMNEVPVSGDVLRMVFMSTDFDEGTKVAASTTASSCVGLAASSTPSGSQNVYTWGIHDMNDWLIVFPSSETSSWSASIVYFCTVSSSASTEWEVINPTGLFVFSSKPSYVTEPLFPVAASWSGTLRISIKGIDTDLSSQAKVLLSHSGDHVTCEDVPVGGGSARSFDDVHTKTAVFDPIPIHRDTDARSVNVFVCLSVASGFPYMAIPVDAEQSFLVESRPRHSPPAYSFLVYKDVMNTTRNETEFSFAFDCGYITEGILATCELQFNGATAFTAADFRINRLVDGTGTPVCPLPDLVFHNTSLRFSFIPDKAGDLGNVQIFLFELPLFLDPSLQLYVPTNDTSDYIVDHTIFRFSVLKNYRSGTYFGEELVTNGNAEVGNTSEPITGWDASSFLASSSLPDAGFFLGNTAPAPDYGLYYFSLTAGYESELSQIVALPAATSAAATPFRVSVRFFHYVVQAATSTDSSDFRAVFDWLDASMATHYNTTVVVSHVGNRLSVIYERRGDEDVEESIPLPYTKWKLFSREEEIDLQTIRHVRVTLVADTTSNGRVVFDEVSVRQVTNIETSPEEVSSLQNLYTLTNGHSWIDSKNWNSGDPCSNHWIGVTCRYSRVVSLQLPHNNLKGSIDGSEVTGLPYLKVLDLSDNQLEGVFAANLSRTLQRLDLSNNKLTALEGSIPVCLERISVANNRVADLPNLWRLPHVSHIDMSNNKMTSLLNMTLDTDQEWADDSSFFFDGATNLQYLNLGRNSITGIPRLQNLLHLHFDGRKVH